MARMRSITCPCPFQLQRLEGPSKNTENQKRDAACDKELKSLQNTDKKTTPKCSLASKERFTSGASSTHIDLHMRFGIMIEQVHNGRQNRLNN
jgi:hypothetical protein